MSRNYVYRFTYTRFPHSTVPTKPFVLGQLQGLGDAEGFVGPLIRAATDIHAFASNVDIGTLRKRRKK